MPRSRVRVPLSPPKSVGEHERPNRLKIRLSVRQSADFGHHFDAARRLVGGNSRLHMRDQILWGGRCSLLKRNQRSDRLAKAFIRNTDDHGIAHRAVRLERNLDFLRKNLLATGVDTLRAAADQIDRALGFNSGPVARYHEALAIDEPKR